MGQSDYSVRSGQVEPEPPDFRGQQQYINRLSTDHQILAWYATGLP